MTSELGGVGPTIVVPGPWTDADIEFQAEHILTMKLHNAGSNCVAAQVLVLPREWAGKRTIRYVDPADEGKPKLQRATVFLERAVHL